MGALNINLSDEIAADIEKLAQLNGLPFNKQAEDLLRWSLGNYPPKGGFAAEARRIAALTPKMQSILSQDILRQDRSR